MSSRNKGNSSNVETAAVNRRNVLLAGSSLAAASAIAAGGRVQTAQAQAQPSAPSGKKPNILVIFGDDIGQSNISAYTFGLMGYRRDGSYRTGPWHSPTA